MRHFLQLGLYLQLVLLQAQSPEPDLELIERDGFASVEVCRHSHDAMPPTASDLDSALHARDTMLISMN